MQAEEYTNLGRMGMMEEQYAAGISRAQVNKFCIRVAFPYGVYITNVDGNIREVLFNRNYNPIIERTNCGNTSNSSGWIAFNSQEWFYSDINPPDRDLKTVRKLVQVLHSFSTGKSIDTFYI